MRVPFTGEGEPELLGAVAVSGEFFEVMGTPATFAAVSLGLVEMGGAGGAGE